MTRYPTPVYLGAYAPIRAGDIVDRYIDIDAELEAAESVSSVAFAVTDSSGGTVASVVSDSQVTDNRVDFRLTVPSAAGWYTLTAVFTISDGQQLTRIAGLPIV